MTAGELQRPSGNKRGRAQVVAQCIAHVLGEQAIDRIGLGTGHPRQALGNPIRMGQAQQGLQHSDQPAIGRNARARGNGTVAADNPAKLWGKDDPVVAGVPAAGDAPGKLGQETGDAKQFELKRCKALFTPRGGQLPEQPREQVE